MKLHSDYHAFPFVCFVWLCGILALDADGRKIKFTILPLQTNETKKALYKENPITIIRGDMQLEVDCFKICESGAGKRTFSFANSTKLLSEKESKDYSRIFLKLHDSYAPYDVDCRCTDSILKEEIPIPYKLCHSNNDDCSRSIDCSDRLHQLVGCVHIKDKQGTCNPIDPKKHCEGTHGSQWPVGPVHPSTLHGIAVCTENERKYSSACEAASRYNPSRSPMTAQVFGNEPCPKKWKKKILQPAVYVNYRPSNTPKQDCSLLNASLWQLVPHLDYVLNKDESNAPGMTFCITCSEKDPKVTFLGQELGCKNNTDANTPVATHHFNRSSRASEVVAFDQLTFSVNFYILHIANFSVVLLPKRASNKMVTGVTCGYTISVMPEHTRVKYKWLKGKTLLTSDPYLSIEENATYTCEVTLVHCGVYAARFLVASANASDFFATSSTRLTIQMTDAKKVAVVIGVAALVVLLMVSISIFMIRRFFKMRKSRKKFEHLVGNKIPIGPDAQKMTTTNPALQNRRNNTQDGDKRD